MTLVMNSRFLMLYKYQYHLTKHEKNTNPEWGHYIENDHEPAVIISDLHFQPDNIL